MFEGLDYEVRLGIAKQKNPAFANFLLDVCDSATSCLINQVRRIYGLFLDDPCFLLSMRLRSFIWPGNLPHDLFCKCGKTVTPTHLFNCNRFITFRSKVHDAVSDQLYFPGPDGSMIIIDVRSTDVSHSSNEKLAPSFNSPLLRAEEAKIIKYAEIINNLNSNSHTQYLLCPFAFSLFETLGKTALSFIDEISSIVKNRTGRISD
ncbi:hypothetical protein P9112_007708 [Eukaryota sp. TZLM1-RC]